MNRNSFIDVVKFFGVVAVVMIHVTAVIFTKDLDTFWNYHWYRPLLNFAVPFFFAASGFLLYNKTWSKENGTAYIWTFALKILRIYIFFSLFYIVFEILLRFTDSIVLGTNFKSSVHKMVEGWNFTRIFNGDIGKYHLWFLAALFLACLILMVLMKLNLSPPQILVVCSLLFVLSRIGYITIDDYYKYGGILLGLFYLSIGFYVASIDVRKIVLPEIGLLISVVLYYLSFNKGIQISELFLSMMTFYTIALCAKYPNLGKGSVLAKLGRHSLKIYLLHLFARDILLKVFVYSGIPNYYNYKIYFPLAIIFSVLFPIIVYKAIYPVFEKLKLIK